MKKNKLHTKETGYTLPDGYFSTFQESLFSKMDLERHEKELPEGSGYKVPEGYFESFQEKISNTVKQEQQPTNVIQLNSYKK